MIFTIIMKIRSSSSEGRSTRLICIWSVTSMSLVGITLDYLLLSWATIKSLGNVSVRLLALRILILCEETALMIILLLILGASCHSLNPNSLSLILSVLVLMRCTHIYILILLLILIARSVLTTILLLISVYLSWSMIRLNHILIVKCLWLGISILLIWFFIFYCVSYKFL